MRPEHYSRDIAQRCGSLIRNLLPLIQKGFLDDAKYGGPLDTTFLLAMATPMVVIPIERMHTPAKYPSQVGDDRKLDPNLSKEVSAVLGGNVNFADAPFGTAGDWRFVPGYSPVFNLADGCPTGLLEALATDEAAARAKSAPISVIFRVLRNALAHGGIAYLDKEGMVTDSQAAMYAFVSTAKDDQRNVVGMNVLRISQSDFCSFLAEWTDWLTRSSIST
jgi:hypothetical protein